VLLQEFCSNRLYRSGKDDRNLGCDLRVSSKTGHDRLILIRFKDRSQFLRALQTLHIGLPTRRLHVPVTPTPTPTPMYKTRAHDPGDYDEHTTSPLRSKRQPSRAQRKPRHLAGGPRTYIYARKSHEVYLFLLHICPCIIV